MTTKFSNSWVNPWEPVRVELWSYKGQRLGLVGNYEEMTFTFADREADTAELTLPLTNLTKLLVPCDGVVLVGMRIGGRTGPGPRKVDTSGVSYAAWVSVAELSASKSSGARRLHQECRLRVL